MSNEIEMSTTEAQVILRTLNPGDSINDEWDTVRKKAAAIKAIAESDVPATKDDLRRSCMYLYNIYFRSEDA